MSIRIALFLSLICSRLLYGQADTTIDLTTLQPQEITSFLATKSSENAKQLLFDAIEKTGTHTVKDCEVQIQYRQYLIRIYNTQGNYKAALKQASILYTFQKKISTPSALSYTKSLINLAYFFKKTGNYSAALKHYHSAASLRKKHLGEKSIAYANVLSDLASIYKIKANYPKAAKLLNEAYNTLSPKKTSAPRDYIAVLNNLADLYHISGAYHKALELYEEIQHFYLVYYSIQKDTSTVYSPSITLQKDYITILGNLAMCTKNSEITPWPYLCTRKVIAKRYNYLGSNTIDIYTP